MKGLALCSVLFCVVAAVLGYIATTGIGARTTSFAPLNIVAMKSRPQAIVLPRPSISVQAQPDTPSHPKALAAPEVVITSVRKKPARQKPVADMNSISSSSEQAELAELAEWVKADPPKPAPAPIKKSPPKTFKPKIAPKPEAPEPLREVAKVESSDPLDTDREWRRQVLERWRNETSGNAQKQEDISKNGDPSLKGTPAEGLFKAEDKKPRAKKRHRFLFIRW
jgi:hypothetical protein